MLFRASDTPNLEVWGWNVEHTVVADADVPAALAAGWASHPLDVVAESEEPAGDPPKRRGRPPKVV